MVAGSCEKRTPRPLTSRVASLVRQYPTSLTVLLLVACIGSVLLVLGLGDKACIVPAMLLLPLNELALYVSWRIFSFVLSHVSPITLASNVVALALVLPQTERALGSKELALSVIVLIPLVGVLSSLAVFLMLRLCPDPPVVAYRELAGASPLVVALCTLRAMKTRNGGKIRVVVLIPPFLPVPLSVRARTALVSLITVELTFSFLIVTPVDYPRIAHLCAIACAALLARVSGESPQLDDDLLDVSEVPSPPSRFLGDHEPEPLQQGESIHDRAEWSP